MYFTFNEDQEKFIKTFGKLVEVFENLNQDKVALKLIGDEKKETLSKLRDDSKAIFDKLSEGKFTVAIVGLENSGKSTLGNALIGIPNLLPTYGLRCTYTVTKVLAGDTERAEVSIYTLQNSNGSLYTEDPQVEKGFNNVFANATAKISTLDPKTVDYLTIDWKRDIEPKLRSDADTNVVKDVQAMLNHRNEISELLNGDERLLSFTGNKLTEPEFKQYITGQKPDDVRGREEDIKEHREPRDINFNGYPYAVKEITIWSTRLKKMSKIVLYDVPGFNSTTALHKEQTENMIDEADAVILIVDLFHGAQITSTQVEMFKEDKEDKKDKKDKYDTPYRDKVKKDKYDTPYKDKVFVFGNMADSFLTDSSADKKNPSNHAKINKNALIKSTDDNGISKSNYIVCGSALLYYEKGDIEVKDNNGNKKVLENEKDVLEYLNLTEEVEIIEEKEVPDASGNTIKIANPINVSMGGVELLMKKLEDYYCTARYDVLKQRVDGILTRASEFLKGINIDCEEAELDDGGEFYYDASENLDNFTRESGAFLKKEIDEINSDKPFSKILEQTNLETIFPDQKKDSKILSDIEGLQPLTPNNIFPREPVELAFRSSIFSIFLKNIYGANDENTKSRKEKIYKELKNLFLQNMGMSKEISVKDKTELEQSVDELFNELHNDQNRAARNDFNDDRGDVSLLLNVLIRYPNNSVHRKDAIVDNQNQNRLLSLVNYAVSQQNNPSRAPQNNNPNDVEGRLKEFFEEPEQQKLLSGLAVDALPLGEWAKELVRRRNTFQKSVKLKEHLIMCMSYTNGWAEKSDNDKIKVLREKFYDCVNEYYPVPVENSNPNPLNLPEKVTVEKLLEIFNYKETDGNTKDDMLRDLNNDIEKLRTFFSVALKNALNREGGFISLIIKDVDSIRLARDNDNGKAAIRRWVLKNTRKIRANGFAQIEKNRKENEKRCEIADNIKNALRDLNE